MKLAADRSQVQGPAQQCPRCKAWSTLAERPVHECPPRWEARDPWGQFVLDPAKPASWGPMLFYGVDAGAAAENVVACLVDRGEVGETTAVDVKQIPAGHWLRVVVDVRWTLLEEDFTALPGMSLDELVRVQLDDVEIGARSVEIVGHRRPRRARA
jgi:hypothetical protein